MPHTKCRSISPASRCIALMWSCHGSFVAARFKCGYFAPLTVDFAIFRACWEDKRNLINFPEPDCGESEGKWKLKWKFLGKGFENCKLIWFLFSMEFLNTVIDWYISNEINTKIIIFHFSETKLIYLFLLFFAILRNKKHFLSFCCPIMNSWSKNSTFLLLK